jgi:anti-anti-sigma regulatory factor
MVELDAEQTTLAGNMATTRQLLLSLAGVSEYLLVDFSRTRLFDAAFVGVLAATWAKMKDRGPGKLAVCGLDEIGMDRLLRICRLDTVLMIRSTRREVLDLLGEGP